MGRAERLVGVSAACSFANPKSSSFAPLYDVTPDGTGFVFVQPAIQTRSEGQSGPQIHVVLNWFEELKERVPVP